MLGLTLDEYLLAHPPEHAERAVSSELLPVRGVLAVVAARLDWSAALGRRVAYVPDALLRRAPGEGISAIRAYYGADVLVAPDSVRFG